MVESATSPDVVWVSFEQQLETPDALFKVSAATACLIFSGGLAKRLLSITRTETNDQDKLSEISVNSMTSFSRQRFDQAGLDRRQRLRAQPEVAAASGAKLERRAHIDPDHVPARCKLQLTLAGEQHVPGFRLLALRFSCR
jgi:hypothetical protein